MQRAVQRGSAALRGGFTLINKQKTHILSGALVVYQDIISATIAIHDQLRDDSDVKGDSSSPETCSPALCSKLSPRFLQELPHFSRAGRAIDFKLSDIGEGISEVVIKEWFVSVGSKVNQFDPICEVQSDKASVTITSRYDGVIKKLNYDVEEMCKVGAALVEIEVAGESDGGNVTGSVSEASPESQRDEKTLRIPAVTSVESGESATFVDKVLATPAVRRFANEMNVSLSSVKATGKHGRVLKDDIVAYTKTQSSAEPKRTQVAENPAENQIVNISGYTRAMVKKMTKSLEIPHFGYKDEVDMDSLMTIRKELAAHAKNAGVKLSYMPFFIKAASVALLEYPILNASLSECQEKIIYKADHNIGLAMDTPQGLIVPNIKQCQTKSILEIAAELNRLQEACLAGRVNSKDLVDTTFSLSNIGSIGGTYAFPVIVQPEVCIGALGRIRKLPRFSPDGNIVPAHILNVSWSADHRIIDGATVSRFSNLWKNYLEKPHSLLMHLK